MTITCPARSFRVPAQNFAFLIQDFAFSNEDFLFVPISSRPDVRILIF